jgi:Tat protein secretion system quality control protein TatD with DNase activity
MEQLMEALDKYVHTAARSFEETPKESVERSKAPEVFISYCWTNSLTASKAREVKQCVGKEDNVIICLSSHTNQSISNQRHLFVLQEMNLMIHVVYTLTSQREI